MKINEIICKRPHISGHIYELKKRLGTLDIIGRKETYYWWVLVLDDHNLGFTPKDYPKHFKKVCGCDAGEQDG